MKGRFVSKFVTKFWIHNQVQTQLLLFNLWYFFGKFTHLQSSYLRSFSTFCSYYRISEKHPPDIIRSRELVNPERGVSKSGELGSGKWEAGRGCDVVGLSVAGRTSLCALSLPHASAPPVSSIFEICFLFSYQFSNRYY